MVSAGDSDRPDYRPVSYGIGIVLGGALAFMATVGIHDEVTRDDFVIGGTVISPTPDWGDVFVAGVFAVVGLVVVIRSFRGLHSLRSERDGTAEVATQAAAPEFDDGLQPKPLGAGNWKRQPDRPLDPAPPAAAAGWYPDPHGRFEQRYWNGAAWTNSVLVDGVSVLEPDVQ